MPPKRKSSEKKPSRSCICGDNCHEDHSHLPGLLLTAFGVLGLANIQFAAIWPIAISLLGVVLVSKVIICRMRS